ncbi:MAG: erythrose-4-phosphate dehydrogenase [Betaproteobacteria bacterium HGW-Betaproteobacteria-13]|jgi:glyceraldehyde 3-phosphate dehydrogenase/D-erythrose 4-phosphate dehydrogenase|nr:MAG: erythrose-4-phosphate dehydrogenase [Betaproteobacteria bacterium HGW-Betaproteobacteria-19]PKO79387.1 MAG: erythrose-4-phosphate dehydrogenase [Betaproteobacteria bacterium HGW-Betaproteobacteria-13]
MAGSNVASSRSNPFRIAINGYGRIGRCFLRALHESSISDRFKVVAINEPADLASIAYLTRFDSTHGRFPGRVVADDDALLIGDQMIAVTHATTPEGVDWAGLELDLVVECSGQYSDRAALQRFLDAGCPRLLLSHPGNSAADVDATIVHGINDATLTGTERLVSNASCTTNAVVPVLDLLHRELGIEQALLTTLHSAMNDQPLIDGYHDTDLRRTRSAMQSIIPVSTGLARGVERLLPALTGRVHAKAIRVPTHNVSAIDMVLTLERDASAAYINTLLQQAAAGPFAGLIAWSDETHASIDFNHDAHSAIVDGSQTRSCGPRMVNLLVWFDNEWGFANRMLDVSRHWLSLSGHTAAADA